MKEKTIAGPAEGTWVVSTKKMPVPIVAPTPNIVSWKSPIVRTSPVSRPPGSSGLRRIIRVMSGSRRAVVVMCRSLPPNVCGIEPKPSTAPWGPVRPGELSGRVGELSDC